MDVSGNEILNVSNDLCNLDNLKQLDLSGNQLPDIPPSISYSRKLVSLNLQNNPFKDKRLRRIANENNTHNALISYLRRQAESGSKGKSKNGTAKLPNLESTVVNVNEKPPNVVILRAEEEEVIFICD